MRTLHRKLIILMAAACGATVTSVQAQVTDNALQSVESQPAPVPNYTNFGHLRSKDTARTQNRHSVYAPMAQSALPVAPTPSITIGNIPNDRSLSGTRQQTSTNSAIPRSVSREAAKMSLESPPEVAPDYHTPYAINTEIARNETIPGGSTTANYVKPIASETTVIRANAVTAKDTNESDTIQPCAAISVRTERTNQPSINPPNDTNPASVNLPSTADKEPTNVKEKPTAPFSLENATADTPIPFPAMDKDKSPDDFNVEGGVLGSMATVITSLVIVIGAFLMAMWLLRRTGPKSLFGIPEEAFESLGRAPLAGAAGKQSVHLIRLGTKLILLSVTPDGATPLVEIDDPEEVDRICGLCHRDRNGSSTDSFQEVIRQLTSRKSTDAQAPSTARSTRQEPVEEEVTEEAIRLQRLRETSRQGARIGNYTIDSYQAATGIAGRGEGA